MLSSPFGGEVDFDGVFIGKAIDAGFVGEDDFGLSTHGLAPLLLIPSLGVEMVAGEGVGGDQQEYEWQQGFHGLIISFWESYTG